MSWRDQLRPASFRGAGFHVTSADTIVGRRVVVHEYPYRDEPYVEDMGRRARSMRIEAFVVGDDYRSRRDALIAAVEQAGPGTLVHPYYGELTVSVDEGGVQVNETTDAGGMARITFAVIESGKALFPAADVATAPVVNQCAIDASDTTAAALASSLDVHGLPAFAFDTALGRVDEALTFVEDIVAVIPTIDVGPGVVLDIIKNLRPDLVELMFKPMELAARIGALFDALRDAGDPEVMVDPLGTFTAFGADPGTNRSTPSRTREADNDAALIEFVRCTAAIARTRVVTELPFTDQASAASLRDSVVAQVDQVADTTPHDDLYQALSTVRAAIIRDIGKRGADLARLVQVTPPDTVPAVVLAYELYDDTDRDEEIVARNAIVRPGFLPGGKALEVLSGP